MFVRAQTLSSPWMDKLCKKQTKKLQLKKSYVLCMWSYKRIIRIFRLLQSLLQKEKHSKRLIQRPKVSFLKAYECFHKNQPLFNNGVCQKCYKKKVIIKRNKNKGMQRNKCGAQKKQIQMKVKKTNKVLIIQKVKTDKSRIQQLQSIAKTLCKIANNCKAKEIWQSILVSKKTKIEGQEQMNIINSDIKKAIYGRQKQDEQINQSRGNSQQGNQQLSLHDQEEDQKQINQQSGVTNTPNMADTNRYMDKQIAEIFRQQSQEYKNPILKILFAGQEINYQDEDSPSFILIQQFDI